MISLNFKRGSAIRLPQASYDNYPLFRNSFNFKSLSFFLSRHYDVQVGKGRDIFSIGTTIISGDTRLLLGANANKRNPYPGIIRFNNYVWLITFYTICHFSNDAAAEPLENFHFFSVNV